MCPGRGHQEPLIRLFGIPGGSGRLQVKYRPVRRLPHSGGSRPSRVPVTVNAADNVGVTRVDMYVDGVLTRTSSAAPLTTSWNPRKASVGTHTLVCRAFDAAGNATSSAGVSVVKK